MGKQAPHSRATPPLQWDEPGPISLQTTPQVTEDPPQNWWRGWLPSGEPQSQARGPSTAYREAHLLWVPLCPTRAQNSGPMEGTQPQRHCPAALPGL